MAGTHQIPHVLIERFALWCSAHGGLGALFPTFFLSLFWLGGGWGVPVFAIISQQENAHARLSEHPMCIISLHHYCSITLLGIKTIPVWLNSEGASRCRNHGNRCVQMQNETRWWDFGHCTGEKWSSRRKKQQAQSILRVMLWRTSCVLTFKAPLNQQPLTRDTLWIE